MKMKKIFATSLLLLSAAAFVACSNDDDDTPGPSVKYDVISFEPSTGMKKPKFGIDCFLNSFRFFS